MQPYSVTGHRPNKLCNAYPKTEAYNKLLIFTEWIIRQHANDMSKILIGMAQGFDIAMAHSALVVGVPVVACIPFKGQETMWPFDNRQYYHEILSKCSEVVYVCDPGYENWKMQKRNMYMVDNSAKQIALHDGTKGGTYNCVKYAKGKGVESINYYRHWIDCAVYYGLLPF